MSIQIIYGGTTKERSGVFVIKLFKSGEYLDTLYYKREDEEGLSKALFEKIGEGEKITYVSPTIMNSFPNVFTKTK